jgi:hypothetical protein
MWIACLRCGYFKGLNTSGSVECEVYGRTEPKLICIFFKLKARHYSTGAGCKE